MTHPLYVGDTLYAESVILDKRDSKSRPYGGIVTAKTRGINQDGKTVIQWKRTFFVYKKALSLFSVTITLLGFRSRWMMPV